MPTITARAIVWTTTAENKTTAAFTPAANDLLVAIVGRTGTDNAPTMSDSQSGAWTLVDSYRWHNNSVVGGLRIYVRDTAVSASSMTVTMSGTGDTGGGLAVLSVAGTNGYGSAAVETTGGLAQQVAGTTPAPVLGAVPSSSSAIVSAVMDSTNGSANAVPRTGYTEYYDQGYNNPATGIEVNGLDSGETSATITYGGTTPSQYACIAIAILSGSQTFNQTVTASAVTTALTSSKTTNKGITAGLVSTALSLVKSVEKGITVGAVSTIHTLQTALTLGKTVTTSAVTTVMTMTRTNTFGRTIDTAVVTTVLTSVKNVSKGITTTVVSTAFSLIKSVNKGITVGLISTTLQTALTVSKTVATGVVTTAMTMARGLSLGRTINTAAVTTAATMSRGLSFGRTITTGLVSTILNIRRYKSYGLPFLYTAANWGTASFYLEVNMRATSGTARARLVDSTGAEVSGSEVTTTSNSFVRVRSSALTLTNAQTYSVQFGTDTPDSGEFRGAKIIVV